MSCVGAPPALQAQYFGRNKVQYKQLDFQVLKTEHFDIYFYPEEREAAEIAARMAERWYARLSSACFDHQLRGRQPLVLYALARRLRADQRDRGRARRRHRRRHRAAPPPHRAAARRAARRHRPRHRPRARPRVPVRHHRQRQARAGRTGAERLPLWFIEGMAEYLSLGPVDPNDRDVDARAPSRIPRGTPCRRSGISTIRGTSHTGMGTRSGLRRRTLGRRSRSRNSSMRPPRCAGWTRQSGRCSGCLARYAGRSLAPGNSRLYDPLQGAHRRAGRHRPPPGGGAGRKPAATTYRRRSAPMDRR